MTSFSLSSTETGPFGLKFEKNCFICANAFQQIKFSQTICSEINRLQFASNH